MQVMRKEAILPLEFAYQEGLEGWGPISCDVKVGSQCRRSTAWSFGSCEDFREGEKMAH